jgi:hypothetical protein
MPIEVVAGVAYSVVGADHPKDRMDIRSAVMSIWDLIQLGQAYTVKKHRLQTGTGYTLDDIRCLWMYAIDNPTRRPRTLMDTAAMAKAWVPIIKGLATAHDKATLDRCEFESEQHMTPLLAAPVAQLREFFALLVHELKEDDGVPFFVWAMFEAWGEVILKHAPDGDVRELKDQLAGEVAALVEPGVIPDLRAALQGALRWRSPETLAKVKDAVEKGARPRMVGRESCLFLSVQLPDGTEESVML